MALKKASRAEKQMMQNAIRQAEQKTKYENGVGSPVRKKKRKAFTSPSQLVIFFY